MAWSLPACSMVVRLIYFLAAVTCVVGYSLIPLGTSKTFLPKCKLNPRVCGFRDSMGKTSLATDRRSLRRAEHTMVLAMDSSRKSFLSSPNSDDGKTTQTCLCVQSRGLGLLTRESPAGLMHFDALQQVSNRIEGLGSRQVTFRSLRKIGNPIVLTMSSTGKKNVRELLCHLWE